MNAQPSLPGIEQAVTLTERQAFALQVVREHGPIRSEDLGAWLHSYRRDHGGRGHAHDAACDYCGSEGAQMGSALKAKDLLSYRRGDGWVVAEYEPEREPSAQLGAGEAWPEDMF